MRGERLLSRQKNFRCEKGERWRERKERERERNNFQKREKEERKRGREEKKSTRERWREEDFPPSASSRDGSNFRCEERGEGRAQERWRRTFPPPSPYARVCPDAGESSTLSRARTHEREREESEENFPPRDGNISVARVRAREEKRKEERKRGEKEERDEEIERRRDAGEREERGLEMSRNFLATKKFPSRERREESVGEFKRG